VSTAPAEVPVDTVRQALAGGDAYLLDVREPWEHQKLRIAGAVLIPMAQVPARLGEIPADRDVYVHCAVGARSARVVEYLRSKGIERSYNMGGGIEAWAHAGLPVEE
jgi:sulfur-carrier protein adenylyltransferase/sulfurtransferase